MVSLHRGRFVVVQLYSTFSVDPLNFSLGANLYPKLPFFAILQEGYEPTFKATDEIWHEGADLGLPSSRQIL